MQIPVDSGLWGLLPDAHYLPCRFLRCRCCDTGGESLVLVVRGWKFLECGLHAPDLPGVLADGAIAGELSTSGNVVDHLLGPFLGVLMRG